MCFARERGQLLDYFGVPLITGAGKDKLYEVAEQALKSQGYIVENGPKFPLDLITKHRVGQRLYRERIGDREPKEVIVILTTQTNTVPVK